MSRSNDPNARPSRGEVVGTGQMLSQMPSPHPVFDVVCADGAAACALGLRLLGIGR